MPPFTEALQAFAQVGLPAALILLICWWVGKITGRLWDGAVKPVVASALQTMAELRAHLVRVDSELARLSDRLASLEEKIVSVHVNAPDQRTPSPRT